HLRGHQPGIALAPIVEGSLRNPCMAADLRNRGAPPQPAFEQTRFVLQTTSMPSSKLSISQSEIITRKFQLRMVRIGGGHVKGKCPIGDRSSLRSLNPDLRLASTGST